MHTHSSTHSHMDVIQTCNHISLTPAFVETESGDRLSLPHRCFFEIQPPKHISIWFPMNRLTIFSNNDPLLCTYIFLYNIEVRVIQWYLTERLEPLDVFHSCLRNDSTHSWYCCIQWQTDREAEIVFSGSFYTKQRWEVNWWSMNT